jgi:hypothetical protein
MAQTPQEQEVEKTRRKETEAEVTMKLKRGTFSATFSDVPCGVGTRGSSVGGDFAG